MSTRLAAGLLLVMLLQGCSFKHVYQAIQNNQKQACYELPNDSFDECMRRFSMSYEVYQQRREELVQARR